MNKLHQYITYSFLIAGLTKFAPDRSFRIIKKVYKVNFISSIYELVGVIEESSSMGINKAQLVGSHYGRVIVPTYDWASFLGRYFNKLPNIKKYHHFHFARDEPGRVYYKENSSSVEKSFMLLKDTSVPQPPAVLPTTIPPEGLSDERKTYLYCEIRQFCKHGTEDLVAPAP